MVKKWAELIFTKNEDLNKELEYIKRTMMMNDFPKVIIN